MASGVPYTIFRPCRLTDGPYTSFDLNTVLKATRGSRREVHLSLEDTLSGEASRITVAGEQYGPCCFKFPVFYAICEQLS